MIAELLKYWQLIVGTVAVLAAAYITHELDRGTAERQLADRLAAQVSADSQNCNADKAITAGANHDLQTNLNATRNRVAELERVHPSTCIVVPAPGRAGVAATKQAGRTGQNGTTTRAFRDYAADYKSCQVTLDVCERFVRDERINLGKRTP